MADGLASRLCALNSLVAVFEAGHALDMALDKNANKLKLSKQDKSFAHAICGFVLRYKIPLQALINNAADRKGEITPAPLNILLLMGAAQIYLMEVPDHAAVNTSVALSHKIKCSRQKGFVNAVLRRLLKEGKQDLKPSLPRWLLKTWEKDYGKDIARKIEIASLQEADIGVVNKKGEWRKVESLPELSSDEWVQDFASYYPVAQLEDIKDKVVFDLCAAPGGKTMQLASKGAKIISVDVSERRLRRLKENLERTQLADKVEIVCSDIMKWKPKSKADIIILDAPCSATGTIRRHPDLPYVRKEKDIVSLTGLQAELLNRVKDWLNPNGILVYCTCSLQKDEGERQINVFVKFNPDFERIPMDEVFADHLSEDGDIRLLPTYGSMDGFFTTYLRFKP